ncbi:MAG: transposase [Desulfobacteraceae bacterium]|nr:transposase [Desulfobacteraceae bacterium]
MFIYNYRTSDRYDVEVVSLAVLTDDNPGYRPNEYKTERWGCKHVFTFPIVKVLDYGKNWQKLEQNPNPFAIVVMAHLRARQIKDGRERKRWKLRLIRMLYERGYGRKHILELFRFIDWLLVLPENLEIQFRKELTQITEGDKMPYVTSIERLAKKEGVEEGVILNSREMVLQAIASKFQTVPEDMVSYVNRIETGETLKSLLHHAIVCENIDKFRDILRKAH